MQPSLLVDDDYPIIEQILNCSCLYSRLGVSKLASKEDIRRAYLLRSKICHPDRQRSHPHAKESFQRLSSAYQTLSNQSSRMAYDLYGHQVEGNDQTLSDALSQVLAEFLSGHYDSLVKMVDYLHSLNPEIKISGDSARQLFSSVREFCLWGGKCWGAAKFEIIHLYELQYDLRSLSYFDVLGRLKLTLALSKGFLKIPLLLGDLHPDVFENKRRDSNQKNDDTPSHIHPFAENTCHIPTPCTTQQNSSAHPSSPTSCFYAQSTPQHSPLSNNPSFHIDTILCRLLLRMINVLERSEVEIFLPRK